MAYRIPSDNLPDIRFGESWRVDDSGGVVFTTTSVSTVLKELEHPIKGVDAHLRVNEESPFTDAHLMIDQARRAFDEQRQRNGLGRVRQRSLSSYS